MTVEVDSIQPGARIIVVKALDNNSRLLGIVGL